MNIARKSIGGRPSTNIATKMPNKGTIIISSSASQRKEESASPLRNSTNVKPSIGSSINNRGFKFEATKSNNNDGYNYM